MAVQITVADVNVAGDGSVTYELSNGRGATYQSLDELKDVILQSLENEGSAELIAMAWWLARSSDGSNTAIIAGKTFTIDMADPNPIKVQ